MSSSIEIRADGTVIQQYLPIGEIKFHSPFPSEFKGEWFRDEVDDELEAQVGGLEAEVKELGDEIDELRDEVRAAEEDRDAAESLLSALRDEVRAFLTAGDFADDAVARLQEALEASE
ncbi:MAG: hypothetical protein GOVbin2937_64 [Prokaryotic dsDNA virus sp.]|nr:MAG: hypothetical protein GOVbin2937_64 [Prokaryotic dsDNA virus sp.]|tara:strand:- start:14816 stop:15169 length:354 start_codon:yes stop_codon:yes gene_type:complete